MKIMLYNEGVVVSVRVDAGLSLGFKEAGCTTKMGGNNSKIDFPGCRV